MSTRGWGDTCYLRPANDDVETRVAVAAVAAAGWMWIENFCGLEFPAGAVGCRDDDRTFAKATRGDPFTIDRARRVTREVLMQHHDDVRHWASALEGQAMVLGGVMLDFRAGHPTWTGLGEWDEE